MKRIPLILIIISVYNCLENRDYLLKRKLETSSVNIPTDISTFHIDSSNLATDISSQPIDMSSILSDSTSQLTNSIRSLSSSQSIGSSNAITDISSFPTDLSSIKTDSSTIPTDSSSSSIDSSKDSQDFLTDLTNISTEGTNVLSNSLNIPSDTSNGSEDKGNKSDDISNISTNILNTSLDIQTIVPNGASTSKPTSNLYSESIIPSFNETTTNISKYILIGFDSYYRPPKLNIIIFYIYFRRISGIFPEFVFFPIRIFYSGRLRRLDEVEKNIRCYRKSKDNDDNMIFLCKIYFNESLDISKITVINNFIFNETESYTIISSLANKTMDNIQDQTGDKFGKGIIVLDNSVLEQNYQTYFQVIGDATEKIKDKTVTLFLYEKENGNIKEVACDISNKGNNTYALFCTSNSPVQAHLNGVSGEVSDKSFLIVMKEGYDNDLVDIYSSKNLLNKNSSSRGLNAGAITGISLACLIAVAAVATIIILCNKTVKPTTQASALELYHSTSSEL